MTNGFGAAFGGLLLAALLAGLAALLALSGLVGAGWRRQRRFDGCGGAARPESRRPRLAVVDASRSSLRSG